MIDFTLNKNMVLQIHTVGEEQTPIIVIDGFVNNVDALINFAVFSQNARETFCAQESDFYPGVRKAAPLSYIERLKDLAPIINSHFDMTDKSEFDVILSAFSMLSGCSLEQAICVTATFTFRIRYLVSLTFINNFTFQKRKNQIRLKMRS